MNHSFTKEIKVSELHLFPNFGNAVVRGLADLYRRMYFRYRHHHLVRYNIGLMREKFRERR